MDQRTNSSPAGRERTIVIIVIVGIALMALCVIPICLIAILTILGPAVGNTFSTIVTSLPTPTPY